MDAAAAPSPAASFPPVTQLGMASIGFVAGGVIYLAAYLPKHVSLGPSIACLAVALLLIAASFVLLLRRPGFAWWRFKQVFAWLLLAYLVVGGMIVYAFVYDQRLPRPGGEHLFHQSYAVHLSLRANRHYRLPWTIRRLRSQDHQMRQPYIDRGNYDHCVQFGVRPRVDLCRETMGQPNGRCGR